MNSGGLTLIMKKRERETLHKAFNKSWEEYKTGFGDWSADNYWLGLEYMHTLTKHAKMDLVVEFYQNGLKKKNIQMIYSDFQVGPELSRYSLSLDDKLYGDLDDLSSKYADIPFSTYDMSSKAEISDYPTFFGAGWWFNKKNALCLTCDTRSKEYGNYENDGSGVTQIRNFDHIKMHLKTSLKSKLNCKFTKNILRVKFLLSIVNFENRPAYFC